MVSASAVFWKEMCTANSASGELLGAVGTGWLYSAGLLCLLMSMCLVRMGNGAL